MFFNYTSKKSEALGKIKFKKANSSVVCTWPAINNGFNIINSNY